jgi:hypothetical protein
MGRDTTGVESGTADAFGYFGYFVVGIAHTPGGYMQLRASNLLSAAMSSGAAHGQALGEMAALQPDPALTENPQREARTPTPAGPTQPDSGGLPQ